MKKVTSLITALLIGSFCFAQYQYLGAYSSDGKPLYLAKGDVVTTQTINLIKSALPESYPVPIYNPQYISSGYDSEIQLKDSAEVWVTFVDEGAGYKNVLGFYTYNLNSPPASVPPAKSVTIIFPNVSKTGSGGSLNPGDKVRIGAFPANTGIGFVLIADGWRNGAVTNGNWVLYSNPAFNPESDPKFKYHNVMILDTSTNHVVLGFEDIRRDYGSDNDFNDALFYITANPYTAIRTSNLASIESANLQVSSGNTAGLESDGHLASKIARRNFERLKKNTAKYAVKEFQSEFRKKTDTMNNMSAKDSNNIVLSNYFPLTGMFSTEIPRVSTPADLTQITNAVDVFSVDYYINSNRVSAGLATRTLKKVYSHTKTICDRLNSSSIEDVRTIIIDDYKLINTILKNLDDEREYVITFSIRVLPERYQLYSLWNIEQYPDGEYLNFQAWGKSMGQVCSLVYNILETLKKEAPLIDSSSLPIVPDLYIKKGHYQEGKLYLTINNKPGLKSVVFNANYTNSETGDIIPFSTEIPLNGELVQDVVVQTGPLFDIGFSITYPNNLQQDGLYMADGAWGTDYDSSLVRGVKFLVGNYTPGAASDQLIIERNPSANGQIKGIFNLFRNTKAGNLPVDISQYNNFSFDIQSDKPVEVIIVANDLVDWDKRSRFTIPESPLKKRVTLPVSKFVDNTGTPVSLSKIRTLVFSVKGNYQDYTSFNISLGNVNFNNESIVIGPIPDGQVIVYPNPVVQNATFVLPDSVKSGVLTIADQGGKLLFSNRVNVLNGRFVINTFSLTTGIYLYKISCDNNKTYKGKFCKE